MATIGEVMTTNPNCCLSEDSSTQAARIMEQKQVGIVPVVESETHRKLIGVVTDRDLCLSVVARGKRPDSVRVREAMTATVVTCRPDDDVQKASDLMQDNQIRRIPVVDQQGILQGMVSMADILQRSSLSPDMTHKTLKKVTEPTSKPSKPRAREEQAA